MNKYITVNRFRYLLISTLLSSAAAFATPASAAKTHQQLLPVKLQQQNLVQSVVSNKPQTTQKTIQWRANNRPADLLANRFLVEFFEAPVAKSLARSANSLAKQQGVSGSAAQSLKKQLQTKQKSVLARISSQVSEMKVHTLHQVLFNGAQVELDAAQINNLRAQPEVKAVYPVRKRYLDLDASHQVTQTIQAWQSVGGQSEAGKGIKIAVVDTGIRPENPMFDDTGFAAVDLSDNTHLTDNPDYCRATGGDPEFCNNKLVVARAIDPAQHGMQVYSGEYLTPLGFDGHGTHVAGIAAGNPVNIEFNKANLDISGVAPGAQLMVYKALYMSDLGVAFGTDTMLLQALELAVLDGANVINNSWGAGSGEDPAASIYNQVFASAEAAGIVVVNAAGNTGHPGATINCPACIESGIAVANTTHGRFIGHRLEVNDKSFLAYQGNNDQLQAPLQLNLMSLNSLSPLDDTGCGALDTDYFTGAIVLVDYRPFCTVEEVANNIKNGGGEAVLIYQAGAFGMGTYEPFIPFEGQYSIPVFGLSRENGNLIFDDAYEGDYTLHISHEAEQGIESQYVDIVNPFSSTGPNNDPSVLKPDLAAPGTHVLSAYSPDEFVFNPFPDGPGGFRSGSVDSSPVFAMLTGTSMASPQVAGAAALLKQQYPNWSPAQIKSALMSTSATETRLGVELATAFQQGAGRLDTFAALNSRLRFASPSWSSPACIGSCSYQNTLNNETDEPQQWQLEIDFFDGETRGQVSPESITLAAIGEENDSADISIMVDATRANPEHRLYDKWVFGRLTATNTDGEKQHMPVVIYANDSSDEGSLLVSYDGNDLQSQNDIEFTTRIRNISTSSQANATLSAPENARFVTGSSSISLDNAETTELTLSEDGKSLYWQGTLQPGSMILQQQALWDDFTLSDADVAPLPCQDGCNGFNTIVEFDFRFNGDDYQTLTISDNGFAVPGSKNFGFFTALFNQHFPQSDNLNNIIAPFWTEFDLLDDNLPGDTGTGYLRAAVRVIDDINYLVVEWDNVALYNPNELGEGGDDFPGDGFSGDDEPAIPDTEEAQSAGFTFQIIIQENSDNIWFNYIAIPETPVFLTVGAENSDGTIGNSYYFYDESSPAIGTVPTSGMALQLLAIEEGEVQIHTELALVNGQDYAQEDFLEVAEDSSVTIDVMANDISFSAVTLSSELQLHQAHKAISTARVEATGGLDANSIEVLNGASHGSVSINEGQVVYQPEADFFGEDVFTYRIADGAGHYSAEVGVNISVLAVNDAPELAAFSPQTVSAGQTVVIAPQAIDVDGDALSFSIVQTAGLIVPIASNEQGFEFTAPDVTEDTLFRFAVSADDGQASSAAQAIEITVEKPRSSGGSLYWLLGLIALALLIRFSCANVRELYIAIKE
ncbi:S8 family serine peptidase [Planctobacterium marinum]|uniref:Serine protease, subtilase family n=1 Tax=Planctobacterium marinum TaxID=1631968 RepID=A0AA48KRP6_9ALTE|nr:hypothetical protein MACH26_11650 [Planctobacterium marinum]